MSDVERNKILPGDSSTSIDLNVNVIYGYTLKGRMCVHADFSASTAIIEARIKL